MNSARRLREITRMGFPPRAWFAHERISINYTGVFAAIIFYLLNGDPEYVNDFWGKPGYLGFDPTPSLQAARVQHKHHSYRHDHHGRRENAPGCRYRSQQVPEMRLHRPSALRTCRRSALKAPTSE